MDDRIIRLPIPIDPSRFQPKKLPFTKGSANTISQHSFLHENGDAIYVKPGEHEVTDDLTVPPHRYLRIPEGTTLRFHENATFVCKSLYSLWVRKKTHHLNFNSSQMAGPLNCKRERSVRITSCTNN